MLNRIKFLIKLAMRKYQKARFIRCEESDCIQLQSALPPTCSMILLHGLGASGQDLVDITTALSFKQPVRWILPNASVRSVSLRGQAKMRAWYDVYGLGVDSHEDVPGLQAAASKVHEFIQQEVDQGIPAERILLGGFSQGAALALYAGLRYPQRLGGIVALSGYLPLARQLKAEAHPSNQPVPIFMAQGTLDTVISMTLSETSLKYLQALGYSVNFQKYSISHTVCLQELIDISHWLVQRCGF
jgi:phospholipase/carboxylesterase